MYRFDDSTRVTKVPAAVAASEGGRTRGGKRCRISDYGNTVRGVIKTIPGKKDGIMREVTGKVECGGSAFRSGSNVGT